MRISLKLVCCAVLIVLAAACAPASTALAQSAGDEQYVDPFQTESGSGEGGGGQNVGGGDGGGAETPGAQGGSGDSGAPPQPPADSGSSAEQPPLPASGGSDASVTATAGGEGALPRTGLPLLALFGTGVLLAGGGFLLRRHV